VKLRVDDGTSEAVFVVFDADMHVMVGRHCFEMVLDSKVLFYGYPLCLLGLFLVSVYLIYQLLIFI
jgi:hypothetical protein